MDMITKLEMGDMHLEKTEFDIVELVRQTFDQFEMKAAKRTISLVFDMVYTRAYYGLCRSRTYPASDC